MEARFSDQAGITIVHLSGRVDYEGVERLQQQANAELKGQKLVFDLSGLSFVGSTAIIPFIKAISFLESKTTEPLRMFGVANEFKRIFDSSAMNGLTIYESRDRAINSFSSTPREFC